MLRRFTTFVFALLAACVYATAPGDSGASLDSRGDSAPGDIGQLLLRRGGEDHAALPVARSEARVIGGRSASRVPPGRGTTPVGLLSVDLPPTFLTPETGSPWSAAAPGTTEPGSGGRSSRGPPPHGG